MKNINTLFAVAALLLVGCKKMVNNGTNPPESASAKTKKSPLVKDANQDFLSEFPTIKFDTMKVEAPVFEEMNKVQKRLNKDYLNLYPSGFVSKNAIDPPLYALSKFAISKKLVGLLIQGAGKRSKTAVTLMIYDHSLQKITSYLEVADHTEDAGYKDFKTTWLFNKDGAFGGFYTLHSEIAPKDANDPTKPMTFNEYFELKINGNTLMPKKLTDAEASKFLKILK